MIFEVIHSLNLVKTSGEIGVSALTTDRDHSIVM